MVKEGWGLLSMWTFSSVEFEAKGSWFRHHVTIEAIKMPIE